MANCPKIIPVLEHWGILLQNNPKNLDLPCKKDLDCWDCVEVENLFLMMQSNFNGSDSDGSSTLRDYSSFLGPKKVTYIETNPG